MTKLTRRSIFGAVAALFGGLSLSPKKAQAIPHLGPDCEYRFHNCFHIAVHDVEDFKTWLKRGNATVLGEVITPRPMPLPDWRLRTRPSWWDKETNA